MDSILTADDISNLIKNPALWIALIWVGRETYHLFKERGQSLDKSIKDNILKMSELTIAIVRLEAKLDSLEKITNAVPKMQDDLNILFRKVRNFDSTSTNS